MLTKRDILPSAASAAAATGVTKSGPVRAATISMIFAIVTAAGVSAAAAGSAHEQFRSGRHEPSRFVAASDDFSSAKRQPRQRLRIVVTRQFWTEPGAIYGYPPGNYIVGSNGILYGPYPMRRSRSVVDLGY